jgi:hypothetical protein
MLLKIHRNNKGQPSLMPCCCSVSLSFGAGEETEDAIMDELFSFYFGVVGALWSMLYD